MSIMNGTNGRVRRIEDIFEGFHQFVCGLMVNQDCFFQKATTDFSKKRIKFPLFIHSLFISAVANFESKNRHELVSS
ncbi:MAG: hypothetical protein DWQ04_19145 [Chloroflexi bacterium]|nr:MAG: hypothetical protein DWQ04_19145 [Chloroflexota bacterium]